MYLAMTRFFSWSVFLVQLIMLLPWLSIASLEPKESQTYIIHMDHSLKPEHFSNHEAWHQHTIKSLSSACVEDKETFLYSYTHVMHGFSAKLTSCQLAELEKSPAHITTYKESFGKMFTTRTPRFLGLNRGSGIWPTASYGKDVIVGVIDTGIWPESESFNDKGMSQVPSRWKGKCENGTAFSPSLCNNKLIGARSFSKGLQAAGINISTEYDFDSARDYFGHGSHTSSTAAGNVARNLGSRALTMVSKTCNYVYGASHFGYANGVAKGIAPRAHLAMYKVLWLSDTEVSAATDVLAGMDQAISDGVDIMSLSLGFDNTALFKDVIAIASLSAIEKGIVVVCAAGNDAAPASIHNGAPWIMTVGAGTLDRSYIATLELGNRLNFEGTSYFPMSVSITNRHLYYGSNDTQIAGCKYLPRDQVKGKVVLCDDSNLDLNGQMQTVILSGAYAAIFLSESLFLDPEEYSLPGVVLHTRYAKAIKEYATTSNNTIVKSMIFGLTKTGTGPAPQVAYFSSRGPDPITPSVLKPDILAPGVDVLGAVRPDVSYIEAGRYELVSNYMLMSGTSMAAPHVAGVAALVKAVHRDWSPAAIRSAMVTTATKTDNTLGTIRDQWNGEIATPLAFGAGLVNPNGAMDPGLIYDMGPQDYINFLCGLGYTATQMSTILRSSQWSCENRTGLNYPTFIANFSNQTTLLSEKQFTRTVRNVGDHASTYRASLKVPPGMILKVEPNTIKFTNKYQEQKFVLTVQVGQHIPKVNYGYLEWIDEHNHIVSSPIVVLKD
ncbi:putative tripeptidyl-peptidase II [Helianthus annuus]|nr:putative tripeptidyl-peptidase II [Helianthus annuus]